MHDAARDSRCRGGVLFVNNNLGVGGSERKTVRLVNALAADGMDVAVALMKDPDTLASAIDSRVFVVRLERRRRLSPATLRRIVRLIRSRGVSTLVAVNEYPSLYCYLAACFIGRRSFRLVASVNTTEFRTKSDARKMAFFAPILRRFDLVLFGAESQRQLWSTRYAIGHARQVTDVLYNGVDIKDFSRHAVPAASIPGWPTDRLIIGCVARLYAEKKQDDILRAVSELRKSGLDVGAVLVGKGPERPSLERLIESLEIGDAVALVGQQPDVRPFIGMMDVFVLPSVETFSNAALEAMAMSCPVVATTVGGMPEMLNGGGGMLYPPGDLPSLINHLTRLLRDEALRKKMGEKAREVVESRFSHEAMVRQFRRLVFGAGV